MRILIQSRETLHTKPGGDTRQVKGLHAWLTEFGHEADVSLVPNADTTGYDVVHIHGIMRPHETWAQVLNAKRHGTPAVVSPCYQDLALYNRMGRHGFGSILARLLRSSGDRLEWMRSLGMLSRHSAYRVAAAYQRRIGFTALQRRIVSLADGVVFSSQGESDAAARCLGAPSVPHVLIPNGMEPASPIDPSLFEKKFGLKKYVLCAGRIEDLKNQLGLLSALHAAPLDVVLAGAMNPRHQGYGRAVREKVRSRSSWHHVGCLSGDLLRSCYAAAIVHVQPSWFENFGLATLEALACGTPAVLTNSGYASSHLGDTVSYCDPTNGRTIRTAVEKEISLERRDVSLSARRFEWPRLIPRYIEFYSRVMDTRQSEACDVA